MYKSNKSKIISFKKTDLKKYFEEIPRQFRVRSSGFHTAGGTVLIHGLENPVDGGAW